MSYYNMGIAAEVRMHQLLDEAEHGRLIRGIERQHDHITDRIPLRARVAAGIRRRRSGPLNSHSGSL